MIRYLTLERSWNFTAWRWKSPGAWLAFDTLGGWTRPLPSRR
jgi:hypothetical protein